ncbi:MAG: putative lipid II flippase FtsW [Cyanobacteria bacterium]|nr:putative lipid II flippase FtsW [Cyanobacteriota bacterium]
MENLSNKRINLIRVNIEYYFIFIITALLLVTGMVMVSSTSITLGESYYNDAYYFIRKQIIWSVISIILLFVFSRIDYHKIARISNFLMLISIGLLAIVLIPGIGTEIGGSKRWINLPFLSPQPSEFVKLAVIIYVSDVLNKKYRNIYKIKTILFPAFIFLLIATFLIFMEPDFSVAVTIWILVFILMFAGEVRFKHIIGIVLIWLAFSAGYLFLENYRRERIFAFLNKTGDVLGSNFQINQSLIALGSGGIFGVGLGNSLQKYSYLPEANTDFIFSILGEEFGLIGTLFIVILFILFAFFGIRIALKSKDYLGRLIAIGITSLITIQAIMNIAVSVGVIPVTGMTLPFVSMGGSSLLSIMTGVGILLNISKYRIYPAREEKWEEEY